MAAFDDSCLEIRCIDRLSTSGEGHMELVAMSGGNSVIASIIDSAMHRHGSKVRFVFLSHNEAEARCTLLIVRYGTPGVPDYSH